jgi:hypothetical protein
LRPGWSVGGEPAGVHFHQPPGEVIDALSALLQPTHEVAA